MRRPSPAADVCRRRTTTRRQNGRKQTRRLPERFQRDEQQVGTTTDRRAQSTARQLRPQEKITGLAPIPNLANAQQPIVRSALIPSFRPVSSATRASSPQQPKPTAVATYLATTISTGPSTLKMPKSAIGQTQLLPTAHPPDAAGTIDRVTEAKGYDELSKGKPAAARRRVTVSGTYETFGKGTVSAHRYSNYPMERAKATKSTIRRKAKTATVRPDAMVLTPKTLPSLPSSAPVLPTSSQVTEPTSPQKEPWLQRLFSFKKGGRLSPHRIAVIAAVVVAMIIIMVSIGIAVGYVMTMETQPPLYDGPAMTFSESHCSQLQVAVPWKKCVVGSPPATDSCAVAGRCTAFLYRVATGPLIRRSELIDGTTTYDSYRNTEVNRLRYPLLCKMRTGDNIRIGVCSKEGQCDRLYLGARHGSWYGESTWEDNCDEVNPCWNDTALMRIFGQRNSLTREQCRHRTPQRCKVGVDAVVWMQHLRCKVGRNRTTAKPCEGLPLRLWRCGDKCAKPSYSLCTDAQLTSNCEYTCKNRSALHVLPDGAKCIYNGDQSKEAYCYDGRCFPAQVYNRTDPQIMNKIMNRTLCKRKKRKEGDEAWL